jgi:haloacetate dehalogenase
MPATRSSDAAGFERSGFGREARCAYRLALDNPKCVERLGPRHRPDEEVFRQLTRFGLACRHWFFLAQPDGLPGG